MAQVMSMTSSRGTTVVTLTGPGVAATGADGSVWACDEDGRWYTSDLSGGHVYATVVTMVSGDLGAASDDLMTTVA